MKEEKVPPGNDPSWAKIAQPVLDFLDRPRSWRELTAHMRKLRMSPNLFNNCLAWLENNSKAFSKTDDKGRIIWTTVHGFRRPGHTDPLLEDLIRQGLVEVVSSPEEP